MASVMLHHHLRHRYRFPRLFSSYYSLRLSNLALFSLLIILLLTLFILIQLITQPSPQTLHPVKPFTSLNIEGAPTDDIDDPELDPDYIPSIPHHPNPHVDLDSKPRYLLYTAGYGQFNNQLVSLINAIFMSRHANATLVLPFTTHGKESTWDAHQSNLHDQLRIPRRLVGDYFNYTLLASVTRIILPDIFFTSSDGTHLLNMPSVNVSYRSGGYYRSLFRKASVQYLGRKRSRVHVLTPSVLVRKHMHHFCDLTPKHALQHVEGWGINNRYWLMPIVFRRHNLNCSVEEQDWINIRKALVPRDEFLYAVNKFIDILPKPVITLHLRLFLNGDVDAFAPQDLVDMLFTRFAEQLGEAGSLFVAYSPSSEMSGEVMTLLRNRFDGLVVEGREMRKFFEQGAEEWADLPLAAVLFDMWVCVKSKYFVGRLGSSLSWNVVYWRQALREEYSLENAVVDSPLWYTLESFSKNGKSRNEGPVHGVRFVSD